MIDDINITFAKGGAHLPIAHALCLPEPEIIFGAGFFWGGGGYFLGCGGFQLPRQTPSGRKVSGRKKERIMPSLVATRSALTRTTCVRTHYIHTSFSLVYYLTAIEL